VRFTTLWLDGYGRFTKRQLALSPGLQIIIGPNEQGKSTIRHFLTDMLYGQRRSAQLRTFDESNELRRPWGATDQYGGRLRYVLDDGREFEIHRMFDKKQGTVTIFDCKHMRDVTAEFARHKNREPNFADEHLGLGKAIFVHAATIGPMTLDDLGDDDALAQIREKIVSLADSSDESGTAETALRLLADRSTEIGRPVSHSKKPLPSARARLDALDAELLRARSAYVEIGALETRRFDVSQRLSAEKNRKIQLEEELRAIDSADRARRYAEAERLQIRIDETTQTCFSLSSAREFPLDQTPDVQRAANAAATARAQLERTSAEHAELERQLAEEARILEAEGISNLVEVPEATERELSALEGRMVRLRERIEEIDAELAKAQERFAQAQTELQGLPDFSRVGADPVAWLTQLATSFRVARQSRATTLEKLKRLREEIERKKRAIAGPANLFGAFGDFASESRAYDVETRVYDERSTQLTQHVVELQDDARDHAARMPGHLWVAALLVGLSLICAAVALQQDLSYVFVPAGLFGVASLLLFMRWFWSRQAIAEIEKELLRAQEEHSELDRQYSSRKQRIDALIQQAGYSSLREVEALHEHYVQETGGLQSLVANEQALVRDAQEEVERVTHLFRRVQESLLAAGETVDHEDDIDEAASRAIARYQEYRDAKRRLGESRDRPAQLQKLLSDTRNELEQCQRDEVERALSLRKQLREAGFREESRYTNVLAALQAYNVRTSQVREKLGRVAHMRERQHSLTVRLAAEKEDLAKQQEALTKRLAAGNVDTIEKWHEVAKQATQYRKAWEERARLQERLDSTLRGETMESLHAAIDPKSAGLVNLGRSVDDVQTDLRQCVACIDDLAAEEHELHIAITQRTTGQRALNEIEEERAEVAGRVADLELEQEATAYAASLIEEAARDRHARIAPRVATAAGQYLGRITNGAYNEVMVSRELTISVRIPQTAQLADDPKRRLSKGTVDQIYLALRLALVQSISASGETVPLILDDPFANYDDARLANALALLQEISKTHQILLFTCRQDVARAGEALKIPIVSL